jgi:uncharacterized protein (TIGR02265 family)
MLQIAASAFEGLFIQALQVQGPIVDKLRATGFDPARMETTYTVDVWRKALQVASLEYYPTLSPQDAEFQLGVRMVDGYFQTIIGKLIQAGMPFFSPDSLCKKLPRFFSSGVVGPQKMPVVTKVAEKHYTIQLYGDQGVPWFTAGSVDASLRKTKVVPTVRVAEVKADNFTLDITWV